MSQREFIWREVNSTARTLSTTGICLLKHNPMSYRAFPSPPLYLLNYHRAHDLMLMMCWSSATPSMKSVARRGKKKACQNSSIVSPLHFANNLFEETHIQS